jgi:hypothetical protein
MPVKNGRVVLNWGGDKPYKVVLEHDPSGHSEHPVDTVAEGEALIRARLSHIPERMPGIEWHI